MQRVRYCRENRGFGILERSAGGSFRAGLGCFLPCAVSRERGRPFATLQLTRSDLEPLPGTSSAASPVRSESEADLCHERFQRSLPQLWMWCWPLICLTPVRLSKMTRFQWWLRLFLEQERIFLPILLGKLLNSLRNALKIGFIISCQATNCCRWIIGNNRCSVLPGLLLLRLFISC